MTVDILQATKVVLAIIGTIVAAVGMAAIWRQISWLDDENSNDKNKE